MVTVTVKINSSLYPITVKQIYQRPRATLAFDDRTSIAIKSASRSAWSWCSAARTCIGPTLAVIMIVAVARQSYRRVKKKTVSRRLFAKVRSLFIPVRERVDSSRPDVNERLMLKLRRLYNGHSYADSKITLSVWSAVDGRRYTKDEIDCFFARLHFAIIHMSCMVRLAFIVKPPLCVDFRINSRA